MVRKQTLFACSSALLLALAGGPVAHAQSDSEDRTLQRAGKIASQPVRDVGLAKDKIPEILKTAFDAPYATPRRGCSALTGEFAKLNAALGPDFGSDVKGDDKVTQVAEAGGTLVVNSLIPFRGIVREVSGAASAERRKRAAINAGLARRGYLRGIAQARSCKLPGAAATKTSTKK